ncbi:DUF4136 domain-containing protein [Tellurirhabdus bombi]|uniref:DUF4136 domain-containing protein n=1 Tax=Tellurirhabdus bombi TaxID=2907205 RepID=UPI001F3DB61A|nr:DUF4136 domain-containing protein [Tellurirhabdus bombi]
MKNAVFVIGLLFVLGSCARPVTVDYNSRVNFDKYKTYAWMDSDVKAGQNPLYYNDIATQNVENSVNTVLNEKGLKQDESDPDVLIGYHFFVEKKTRTVTDPAPLYGPFYGWGRWGWRGWGPSWYGWGGPQSRTEQYNEGTVVVDIVDAKTRKLVWRGSVENAIADPARISAQLPKDVRKILEKYGEEEKS